MPAKITPNRLSPTIRPDAISTPSCLVARRFALPLGPLVVPAADQRADQISSVATSAGRCRCPRPAAAGAACREAPSSSSITITPTPISRADADQAPVEVAADHALGQRRDQRGLRRGQRVAPDRARARRRSRRPRRAGRAPAGSPPRRRPRRRPARPAAPRRGVDQLAGLEVLQVVVGDRGHGEHDRGDEQRERDQRLASASPAGRDQRRPAAAPRRSTDEDADARDRAVGRADQPGHVAADRRRDEPPITTRTMSVTHDRSEGRVARAASPDEEAPQQHRDRDQAEQR